MNNETPGGFGRRMPVACRQAGRADACALLAVEGELSEVESLADQLTENSVRHDLQLEEDAGDGETESPQGMQ